MLTFYNKKSGKISGLTFVLILFTLLVLTCFLNMILKNNYYKNDSDNGYWKYY